MNVLIINAHLIYKGFSEGRLNKTYVDTAIQILEQQGCNVKTTHIEKGYTIEEEIAKHEWADLVITQTPVNWFGTPWMHKKYIDIVLTAALSEGRLVKNDGRTRSDASKQYGSGGLAHGKQFLLSTTWNAPENAFGSTNQQLLQGKTEDDVFLPLMATYKFCGYTILPGFHTYNVIKSPTIEDDLHRFTEKITQIIANFNQA